MFFAVGCNDQGIPTEASNPALDAPTLRPQVVVVNEWFLGEDVRFFACGEMNTYSPLMDHVLIKASETPNGQSKFWFHINSKGGTVTGDDTGNEYRANPWSYNVSIMGEDRDNPPYKQHETAHLAAHGINVDTKMYCNFKIQRNILESGEVVLDRFFTECGCR
jgi:hypothetical protein